MISMGETQNVTLSMPKKLVAEMKARKNIRWSRVASEAIQKEIEKEENLKILAEMDKMLSKSKLTEKDAERIGHEIKKAILKRLLNAANH